MPKPRKPAKKSALRSRAKRPTGLGRIADAVSVAKIERRYQVFNMRRDGYSVREIADTLNCGINTVFADLRAVLGETLSGTTESVEEHRQLVLERNDSIIKSFMPQTQDRIVEIDDPKKPGEKKSVLIAASMNAADLVLRADGNRRKMLALDVPETKQVNLTGIREYVGIDLDKV